jgi:hypothetical protein
MKRCAVVSFLTVFLGTLAAIAGDNSNHDSKNDTRHRLAGKDVSGKKAIITSIQSSRWPDITMVRITVPAIPDLQIDVWSYEDALGKGECFPQSDGTMILKHRHPKGATVETRIVPQETTVDWDVAITGPTQEAVRSVEFVNPCWQFRNAPAFRSLPDRYVESFVNRCFIYTERGLTFLKDTQRLPDTRKPADDYRNAPPWVQAYYPVWIEWDGRQPEAGWGISRDRPIYSIIGIVSRDMKYVAAWGGRKSKILKQGWHDCLHLSPLMQIDYNQEENRISSHSRMYFMEFDSVKLLERYKRDFPPLE